ncbi:MAG: bifunctional demethylmenaquinone methyltransferase/2-methoxy-6-polyprenyl-1,4-benzoquinol methylase UbiE [Bacteroidetes bacterium]|nr:bifunctional demethylmenaquinone methyltransferase/2-methoxy-6-polyprenyl-1,4-benzoquinol methylase UbiE [Bacteroidota bacterium]MCY4223624.1 bifunctional demethylmenaquinone methyltransferase/2-methoxy-6-polyprenyl-1,4-benzoquinol methylase UbiE [Bacteroidota bacterium]
MHHYPPVGENESKEVEVASMFDAIAKRYDLLNRVLSFGLDGLWRKAAIRRLGDQKDKRILDVATGTGDVALSVLRLHPYEVVGVDIAEQMLQKARKKRVPKYFVGDLSFVQGSAESLPLLTGTFDAAIVAFGVRNFANLDAGLRSIERVLKPRAPLVVLEFGQPTNPSVRRLYQFYSRFILPAVGRCISGVQGPYDYLPDSIEAFPSGHAFLQRLLKCGFEHTTSETLTCGIVHLYTGYATGKNHSDEL